MSIKLGNYTFEGPYTSTKKIKNKAGIYAIHCLDKGKYKLLDIGESAMLKERIENHERMKCWLKKCSGTITVSVHYTPHWTQIGRNKLQKKLRKLYNPPCGKKLDGLLNFIEDPLE